MNYELYDRVLEYMPNDIDYSKIKIIISENLIEEIRNYTIGISNDPFIVSLSGGVDSMVLTILLKFLNCRVVCLHINYNNRPESSEEARFLEEWCKYINIEFILHEINSIHRGEIKRSEYENITKNIRFKLYKDVLEKYQATEIFLGHHKDDIIENVFNNICRGRNILDLSVIKRTNKIMGIQISRPLISVHKNQIYAFAEKYQVPYFKDTTPDWSLRGIYRNQIYPLLNKTYSNNLSQNLLNTSTQSDEWSELVEAKIIEPFMQEIQYNENIVVINIADYLSSPMCFWSIVFTKIFYRYSKSIPTRKSIQNFMNKLNQPTQSNDPNQTKQISNIKLSEKCISTIKDNILSLNFEK